MLATCQIATASQQLTVTEPSTDRKLRPKEAKSVAKILQQVGSRFEPKESGSLSLPHPISPLKMTSSLLLGRQGLSLYPSRCVPCLHPIPAQQPTDEAAVTVQQRVPPLLLGAHGLPLQLHSEVLIPAGKGQVRHEATEAGHLLILATAPPALCHS